ncbi:EmrB/QacA subfamily drug resistance transporter [Sediminihabitans luteus]|uniref:EmrB/QacA subfamily drug resistance transporter n=1 Tax=Sediminihabitans luteus TaxID=1138585 RepID=A0A2M9CPM2_9CELL|nr:MFS transporter [Sediminihabitans luteus]PJJ73845.1 EmrB/QacA subfamily drug resistance transporter [Sediminihabitans luteus]GII98245.1 MFS transporter [Sediminihabitans luteus]
MSTPGTPSLSPQASTEHIRRRWWILAVLSLTQLVVVLDGTIVNIALPQAQAELGMSDAQRQWVVTAYALVFGALLLLGGRVADYWGRRRAFLVGLVGFGLASAWGGLAQSGGELVAARGLQGLFAALLAPAALGLLTVTFASGRDRNVAFAVYGAIGGGGAAVGLLLGGVLTQYADWRWCLLVNIVFAIVGLVGGLVLLTESKAEGDNRYDLWGAVAAIGGLGSLVYGFTLAEDGWAEPGTIGFLALGVVLLALFVLVESRVDQPLLPLRVVAHRVRAGAFVVQALIGSVLIGATLYLTFHLQIVMGMSPLASGLANVAMTVVIILAVPAVTNLLPKIGPRPLMIAGPLIAAVGLFYLSGISPEGSYAVEVLPALLVLGLGLSFVLVPLQNLALTGVAPHDAGAAAATVNAALQIGGSIGVAVFTVVYTRASDAAFADGAAPAAALTDGYSATFVAAGIAMVVAALVAALMIRGTKSDLLPQGDDDAARVVHVG